MDYSDYQDGEESGIGSNSLASLRELAIRQKELELEVERNREELRASEERLRVISEQTLPEMMDELGVPEFKTSDGLTIKIKETIRASMGKTEKEKNDALRWLEQNGHGAMIKRTVEVPFNKGQEDQARELEAKLQGEGLRSSFSKKVEPSTLRAFVIECLENGQDIPLDLFKVFRQRSSKVELD
jgi:hypothetical protein